MGVHKRLFSWLEHGAVHHKELEKLHSTEIKTVRLEVIFLGLQVINSGRNLQYYTSLILEKYLCNQY